MKTYNIMSDLSSEKLDSGKVRMKNKLFYRGKRKTSGLISQARFGQVFKCFIKGVDDKGSHMSRTSVSGTRKGIAMSTLLRQKNDQEEEKSEQQNRKEKLVDAPGGPAGDVINNQSEQGVLNASSSRRTALSASDKSTASRRNLERGGLDAGRQLLHKMYSFSSYSSSVHLYVEDDIDVGGDCGGISDLKKGGGILCEGYDRDWEKQYASSVFASSEAESLQRMETCGSAARAARRKISQEEKGWGGPFFDSMSGTFYSSRSSYNRDGTRCSSDLSLGDSRNLRRFSSVSSLGRFRRVGYRRDEMVDIFGDEEEDNDEAAGAGGKRVSAESAPRGGGCAASSALKSKSSFSSVTSSFRGTALTGQSSNNYGRKVGSLDRSKAVVLLTPHALPRDDRYPGSPRKLRRRKGAGIGDADNDTRDDDGESIPQALENVPKTWKWEDRPQVSRMLSDLADVMVENGYQEQAADLFERTVDVYLAYDGPHGHGGMAKALNDLGYVLWEHCACPAFAGRDVGEHIACTLVAGAEEVFRLAYLECGDSRGYDHPFAAVCISNLADCASARLAYDEASELLKRALKVRIMSFGPKHLETANTLKKLGCLQHQRGALDDAEECYNRALRIFIDVLGPDHGEVGSALNLIAVVVGEQGRHFEAETFHRRALFQRLKAGASGPDDLAPMLYNLGLVVGTNARRGPLAGRALGELESERLLREALDVYSRGLGPNHPEVADCMDKLGAAVAMNGNLVQAEMLHRKALEIFEKTFGDSDPQVAEVLFNLATVVGAQNGRLQETESYLNRCLQVHKALHGPHHPEVALVLDRLAEVIRVRNASSVRSCNPIDESSNVSVHHGVHQSGNTGVTFGSSGRSGLDILASTTEGKLDSSKRKGTSSAMSSSHGLRGVSNGSSISIRGSSCFNSVPSAYGGMSKPIKGDIRGGSYEAGSGALLTAEGKPEDRMVRRSLSPTPASGSSFSRVAAAHVAAESTCGHSIGVSLTKGSSVGEIGHSKGVSKGVSNEERSDKFIVRDRGVSETGSCADEWISRVGGSSRRQNRFSRHEDNSNESSDSSAHASVEAKSCLSSSTRRQHERRLRKQQQQKQCMRHRLRQSDDLSVTSTSKSTHTDRSDGSSSSTGSDRYTNDHSEEFRSSSEASSLSSSSNSNGSHSKSGNDTDSQSDAEGILGGTSISQASVSDCPRESGGSDSWVGSRSLASNCWSDSVFESSIDSTPQFRSRCTRGAADTVTVINDLPAIPCPIPAFSANYNRRGVTPQTVPNAEKLARSGGGVKIDPGIMAISLQNRVFSRTQQQVDNELEEVDVPPAGNGERLGERVDVYGTGVDAEGGNEGVRIAEGAGRKKRVKWKSVGRAVKAAVAAITGRLETNKKRNKSLRISLDDPMPVVRK